MSMEFLSESEKADVLCDRQYLSGLQQGWNMAQAGEPFARYMAIVDARRREIHNCIAQAKAGIDAEAK